MVSNTLQSSALFMKSDENQSEINILFLRVTI